MSEMTTKVIWKYPLAKFIADKQVLRLPRGYELLTVQVQGPNQDVNLWAMVDPKEATIEVSIYIYGIGQPIPPQEQTYICSVQERSFVWHFFAGGQQ